jgi:hypothetical protein
MSACAHGAGLVRAIVVTPFLFLRVNFMEFPETGLSSQTANDSDTSPACLFELHLLSHFGSLRAAKFSCHTELPLS